MRFVVLFVVFLGSFETGFNQFNILFWSCNAALGFLLKGMQHVNNPLKLNGINCSVQLTLMEDSSL